MKDIILDYMRTNCYGFRNAKPRQKIVEALQLGDRAFRKECEQLKKEGHIATNCKDGYYFIPLYVLRDREEIDALNHSRMDKISRAQKLFEEANILADILAGKLKSSNVQQEFQLSGQV